MTIVVEKQVSMRGTEAGVPIMVAIPSADVAILAGLEAYLNGVNIDGEAQRLVVTETRHAGDIPFTAVTHVQAGGEIVTAPNMRLDVYYGAVQEAS